MSASTLKTEDQRASKLGELQASFSVVDFGPCKGLGVIATRDLIEGEMLLHEEPLLRLRRDGPGQFHCTYGLGGDREKCQGVIDTLSQHSFGRGLDAAGRDAMTSTERAIETNAFVLEDSTALFLEISRFNHSCASSARFSWDAARACGTIIMKQDVPKGTEVTINYGTGKHSTLDKRQEHLFERFSFECSCDRCRTEEAAEEAQDVEARSAGIDRSWGRG